MRVYPVPVPSCHLSDIEDDSRPPPPVRGLLDPKIVIGHALDHDVDGVPRRVPRYRRARAPPASHSPACSRIVTAADRVRNCSMSNHPTSSLSQSTSNSSMSGACRVMCRLALGSTRAGLVTVAVNAAAASVNTLERRGGDVRPDVSGVVEEFHSHGTFEEPYGSPARTIRRPQ